MSTLLPFSADPAGGGAAAGAAPLARVGRVRRSAAMRRMVAETTLRPEHLIYPLFIRSGQGAPRPIGSLPGQMQWTVESLATEIDEVVALGVPAVLLFGIPDEKDACGSSAWDPEGPVPQAARLIKERAPHVLVIADVCMCEYTAHGHCGALHDDGSIDLATTLPNLARTAVAYAEAGCDVVAPSAMLDGMVAAIRAGLDGAGHEDVPILSYAVKYASAFYGPFRDAVGSAPSFGDRKAHQMDPRNVREGVREALRDVAEGADLLMVKPAGAYLDVIARVRDAAPGLPLAAYQVSGEYAMLKAAVERGWLDEERAVLESLVAIRRAGADLIITYYAKDAARWIRGAETTR